MAGKKTEEDKPLTWTDIENLFRNIENSPEEKGMEKLDYFKKKIIAHLDGLQTEEDTKIIPFPETNHLPKKG